MKNFIFSLILIFNFSMFAQTTKQTEDISNQTCECLSKKKNLSKLSMDEVQVEIGLCMLAVIGDSKFDIDISNPDKMGEFGEKIGVQMALNCPIFTETIAVLLQEEPERMNDLMNDSYEESSIQSYGILSSIEKGQFATLKVQLNNEKQETFYWLEYFEGSNLLTDETNSIVGKKIQINYIEKEFFIPKYNEYFKVKVITKLSLTTY